MGKGTVWGRFKAGAGNEDIIRARKKKKKISSKRAKKRKQAAGNRRGLETASPRGGPGPSPAAPVAVEAVVGAAVPLRPPLLTGAALLAALQLPLVAVRQRRQHPGPGPGPNPGPRRPSAAARPLLPPLRAPEAGRPEGLRLSSARPPREAVTSRDR